MNMLTTLDLSIVSLAAYVLTKVSVTVYAGAPVFETLLPDTFGSPQNAFWVVATAVVLGLVATIYTYFSFWVWSFVASTCSKAS